MVLGNGGTTAFWEVAVFGLIRHRAQCASFGEFGGKFAKAVAAARSWLTRPCVPPNLARLPSWWPSQGWTYATPHNETSTGVAVPVRRVAGADPTP